MNYNNLFFDLDGTLIDPKEGILQCICYALNSIGVNPPSWDELIWCIGPPLQDSFKILVPGISDEQIRDLIAIYRECFSAKGIHENKLYDGIEQMAQILTKECKLFVVTSKPTIFAEKIIKNFNLKQYFSGIYGSELDGTRCHKNELISHVIECEKLSKDECLMIGDRDLDVNGAKKVGIDSMGVKWGYAPENELEEAAPNYLVSSIDDLIYIITGK